MARHTTYLASLLTLAALLAVSFFPFGAFAADVRAQPEFPASPANPAAVVNLTAVADATILEGSPDLNLGSSSLLTVERDDFLQQSVALLRFDLSSIPPGSTINSAELQLNLQEALNGFPTVTLDASRVTTAWSEGTVTWNSRPSWICCVANAAVGFSIGTDYVWDVATLVDHWVNNPTTYPNGGVALTGPSGGHQRAFASRDGGSNPPRLVVDYTPPPPDGTISAEVFQANASRKNDDNFIPGLDLFDLQDFYLWVSVNGGPDMDSPVRSNLDLAEWDPPFRVSADVIKAVRFFPVRVELWDSDDTDAHDQFDINPENPYTKALTVLYDGCTMEWSDGTNTFGPGPAWVPSPMEQDVEGLGQILLQISNDDGRSFAPDDVAIAYAGPVQVAYYKGGYHAPLIVADKATSFMVQLSSSWAVPRQVQIRVTMSDGVSTVNQTKYVVVPPDGLRVFFFDYSEGVGPFFPEKNLPDPQLTYNVQVNVEGGDGDPVPPWFNCVGDNNTLDDGFRPIIQTHNPTVVYRRWDYDDTLNPPSIPDANATVGNNEIFREATFPISVARSTVVTAPYFTPFGRGTTDLLGGLPDWTAVEPGQTLFWENIGAMAAGIERMVLVARETFWEDNLSRLTTGSMTTLGLSLGESGPRVVIAEAGTSQTVVHELGHTYKLSQRPCSARDVFLAGCRDEYLHTAADGRPYLADGYDVQAGVYPAGSGGTPGTREVLGVTNFMDTTAAGLGAYDRWVDLFSYNYLLEQMRDRQDPTLVSLSGVIWAKNGFDAQDPGMVGMLFPSYQFEGMPDLEQRPYGEAAGSGLFGVRLEAGQGDRIYRFDPWFRSMPDGSEVAFFAFGVEWDPAAEAVSLWGLSDPANAAQSQWVELFRLNRSAESPIINSIQAAVDGAPRLDPQQQVPPVIIAPGESVAISWDASDADSADLRAILLLEPPPSPGGYNGWLPYGVQIDGNQATIPWSWLALRPGTYGGRVVVSDGVNATSYEQPDLFTIEPMRFFLPVVTKY